MRTAKMFHLIGMEKKETLNSESKKHFTIKLELLLRSVSRNFDF